MARSDHLFLADIVGAVDEIENYLEGHSYEGFQANSLLRSGVLLQLLIIGEAASKLSMELKGRHPDIEWRLVIAFRNFAIHAYFAVDWDIVWEAATLNAPLLRQQVAAILAAEYPDPSSPTG